MRRWSNMKFLKLIPLVTVILLSLAAGFAKVMLATQEAEFLYGFGLTDSIIVFYGVFQLLSGVLIIPTKTRKMGAACAAISFFVSSTLILVSGTFVFGVVSLIPFGLSIYLVLQSNGNKVS